MQSHYTWGWIVDIAQEIKRQGDVSPRESKRIHGTQEVRRFITSLIQRAASIDPTPYIHAVSDKHGTSVAAEFLDLTSQTISEKPSFKVRYITMFS